MNRIYIDVNYLPAVVVTIEGAVADEAYLDYLRRLAGILKTHRPRGVVIDTSLSDMHAPRHAKMQADWVNQHRALLAENILLTALVVPRPVLRFALSAFFAITSLPNKFEITTTADEAKIKVAEVLRSQGVSVPSGFTTPTTPKRL